MTRHYPNEHECYSEAAKAHAQELEDRLDLRTNEMKQEWAKLDSGWEDLESKMSEAGLSMVSSIQPSIMRLNVGGLDLDIPRSVFRKKGEASSSSWTLGDLFEGGVWDKRLPRSRHDRILLDESPICIEELLCDSASSKRSGNTSMPDDQQPYIGYVASALGLDASMKVTGGSTTLQSHEIEQLSAILQGWCPGRPRGMELLYRASRDNWSGDAFHSRCGDESPSTISLFRVKAEGVNTSDSVVGGFSSVPWTTRETGYYAYSPGSFLFMLKNGNEGSHTTQPTMWRPAKGRIGSVCCCRDQGPCFAAECVPPGLCGIWDTKTLAINNTAYDLPAGHPFLALKGKAIVDIEVFRVDQTVAAIPTPPTTPPTVTGLIDCAARFEPSVLSAEEHENDVYRFGVPIAESLKDERAALHTAQCELVQANTMAAASVKALKAVYGPHTADGVEDPIVDLSVRGPRKTERMTTLLSTLQACPDSALAARFDESKWPVTDKDKDAHGRRVITDCSPSVFSKVLDVLRMKKREAWAGDDNKMGSRVLVAIEAADRAPFEQFVNMYFPGCESFIMNSVKFSDDNSA
ncbi:unnamed protein product [Ectocarpus fasciculatus]